MAQKEVIIRYHSIIQKLRRSPASFKEINDYLNKLSQCEGYDLCVSDRTFRRDLDTIQDIYKISIQYNSTTRKYHLDNSNSNDFINRIYETFDLFNALNLQERLSEHIGFEKKHESGAKYLSKILNAIQDKRTIEFDYFKFNIEEWTQRMVHPYFIKEYRQRWYLLAYDSIDSKLKHFALDRMKEVNRTEQQFELIEGFKANDYYKYCFGIIKPEEDDPHDVVLSFYSFQGQYIKRLPFHNSQEVLIDNEDELRIQLHINITEDFIMELLSYGSSMEVIKPKLLKQRMIEEAKEIITYYE